MRKRKKKVSKQSDVYSTNGSKNGVTRASGTIGRKLSEIASFQSHQLRGPIASILGLYMLFRFDDPSNPVNAEILLRLKSAIEALDGLSWEIIKNTIDIRRLSGK